MNKSNIVNGAVLVGLIIATYLNWSWPWGLLFIFWAVPSVRTGEAFLLGPVIREDQPVIFWVVTVLWFVLGLMTILADLSPTMLEKFYLWIWGR